MHDNPKLIPPIINELFEISKGLKPPRSPKIGHKKKIKIQMANKHMKK